MKMLVVGGNSHGIGKTSVVTGIIAAVRELDWLAVKLTQSSAASVYGERPEAQHNHGTLNFTIREEQDRVGTTDTSRFLLAGAQKAMWITVPPGGMESAMPDIRRVMEASANVIVESNSIVHFFEPNVYLSVLDPSVDDFKNSSRQLLHRADALLTVGPLPEVLPWRNIPSAVGGEKPVFVLRTESADGGKRQILVQPEIIQFIVRRWSDNRQARYLFS